ncbi:nucleotide sugar dehydrogenase [Haloplasma contractile]|uniref:UDP-N-acetyl-D-mannosamine dehydrogenase protein n=1 Tax=Haloplasma contractile SSD-17B TaxID=1033810 RepID=F7Q1K5_9MOLU|nr:nucleotide sugar dehydrogenase [Haloplasma contractile]ERJ12936.1 UDP-N-acetyl-D-mannosamine dehydrogenase protein [Haloplasma contractile SSD-17B]
MNICVIGLGYIGLPTAAMFAHHGHQVYGVDTRREVVELINKGLIHIEEPGLSELVSDVSLHGLLKAGTKPIEADVYIIAVPTPNQHDEYMSCDLSNVLSACRAIIPYVKEKNIVIVESTIEPRTMDDVVRPLFIKEGFTIGHDVFLAHCPERVLPGNILNELVYNNRLIGGVTSKCSKVASNVYRSFVKGEIIETEAKTAELSKLMENTYRDINIAIANELTKICHELEINVLDVIEMANKHPRVNIHSPGPGVGGHCLAVDPYFIYSKTPHLANLIKVARDTNNSMPDYVVEQVENLLDGVNEPKVSIFGLSYKGNVDDIRESPSLQVFKLLRSSGYTVSIYDPHVEHHLCETLETCIKDSDLIVVLTDHNEFKTLDHKKIASCMRSPLVLDTKNCITPQFNSELEIINFGNMFLYK